jgi:hypothetical protein
MVIFAKHGLAGGIRPGQWGRDRARHQVTE